jgi:hypothetical protein
VIFLAVSLACYGLLTWWITGQVGGVREEWLFTLGHLTLAAIINAHLFYVARRRSLSFLASPPLAFLLVSHIYFSINGIKYFSPILLYPQFDLTLSEQFAGSIAGGVVLFLCSLLLYRPAGPTTASMQDWLRRYWPDVRRVTIGATIGSLLCKIVLFRLGYGSAYTDSAYNEHVVRSYADYFVLLGNDVFGALSLAFGTIYLCQARMGRARPLMFLLALAGVLLHVGYVLLYLKARMIVLLAAIAFALAAEARSRRLAERALQVLLLILPPASLLGAQLTFLIGRVNLPEDTGMRLAIAAVNRRADLTDFATAIQLQSHGTAHDASIITAAVLNAIPRAVFPGKMEVVKDVYSQILERRLGWPAGSTAEDLQADYLDTSFSNGVMSFGAVGFVLVPLAIVWMLRALTRWLDRPRRGVAYGISLVALLLAAMHTEGEWSSIPANFRQALFIGVLAAGLLVLGRLVHNVLVVATHPDGVRAQRA